MEHFRHTRQPGPGHLLFYRVSYGYGKPDARGDHDVSRIIDDRREHYLPFVRCRQFRKRQNVRGGPGQSSDQVSQAFPDAIP